MVGCLLSTSWQQCAHIITVLIPGERGGNDGEGKEKAERTKNIEPRNCHIANISRPVNDLWDLSSNTIIIKQKDTLIIKLLYEKRFHKFRKSTYYITTYKLHKGTTIQLYLTKWISRSFWPKAKIASCY